MKTLLLGANGQVGWELQRALSPLGQVTACDRAAVDVSDIKALARRVELEQPDVIVNAAAYTAVDRAESDVANARRINAEAVGVLADLAHKLGAWLIHYSTDYVFDGMKAGYYCEDDPTGPLNVYGQTKLEGEQAIALSGCRHLIFRTSWVYAARGGNFAKTMLRLASEREELRVVADQVGAPTSAELIADVTAVALSRLSFDLKLAQCATGVYHLAAAGETSWHGYARFLVNRAYAQGAQLKTSPERVRPISSDEYPVAARRPSNSRLATDKLRRVFGLHLPDWRFHAGRMLEEIAFNPAVS